MKFGIAQFPAHYGIRPDDLAKEVEDRGFDSLFFPEHTHLPASDAAHEQTKDLPKHYAHTYDLFTAMSFAASATSTLLIGSGICLLPQHEPIVAAKAVASIDQLSGGRVLFGIGAGWIDEEARNFGFEPGEVWKVMRDRLKTMKTIWGNDVAEYHGEYRDFGPIFSYPKPVTPGGPPIVVAGHGPNVIKRVLEYGDEWMPNRRLPLDEMAGRMKHLQEEAAAAGRDKIPVSKFGVPADAAHLEQLMELGVDRAILMAPSAGKSEVLSELDKLVKLRDQVLGVS